MFRQLFIDQNPTVLNQIIQDHIIQPMQSGRYSNASKASLSVAQHAHESNVLMHKVFIILLWLYCCLDFQEYFFSQDDSHPQLRDLMIRKIEFHLDLWLKGLCYERIQNKGVFYDKETPRHQNKFGWAVLRIRQYYLAL
jgi:hypothetical protein